MGAGAGGDGSSGPWYRHFWPWFIVLLLGTAITASLVSVWIAVTHRDALVRDDWYEEGRAINRRLELQENARRLGLVATLEIGSDGRDLFIALAGQGLDAPPGLELDMSHPTLAERDRRVRLLRTPDGRYRGRLDAPLAGRWYANLEPLPRDGEAEPDTHWRLSATLELPAAGPIVLGAPDANEATPPVAPRTAG